MALSRESIVKHSGVQNREEVEVPEWRDENGDCTVIVRGLTQKEWEINQAILAREAADDKAKPKGEAAARLIVRCVIDENGGRVFTDADINLIANLSFGSVQKLQDGITKASGIGAEAEEEVRGESEPAQTSSSFSE